MEYKYTGIILSKHDVGETDRIYMMYTLEGGKIRSLAKGVRKPHAKLAASLENITLADITIVRSRGLGKITGSIVEQNFTALKKDYDAIMEVFAVLNIFGKLVDFENPDPKVFQLLKEFLETIDLLAQNSSVEKYVLVRLGFTAKLLDALGYSIEVNSCIVCGKPLEKDGLCFSAQHGGALCRDCANDNPTCSIAINVNAIKMLRLFLQNNISTFSKIQATQKDCDSTRLAIDEFLRWTL